jgi:hypothetical protein
MFGQFSRAYQGKRTVRELRDVAFERYGKAVHNTRRVENNTLDVDLYADSPSDPIRAIILHETPIVQFLKDELIAGAIKSLRAKGIPHDPKGDPWVMPDSKTGLFEAGVVREWIRSDYLTQSLVWAALNWAGAGSVDVGRPWYLQGIRDGTMPHALNFVRRYLKACLGVGA